MKSWQTFYPAFFLCTAFVLVCCARQVPTDMQAYEQSTKESPSYHKGYADGCEAANLSHDHDKIKRDNAAFQDDTEYRLGWVDGKAKCDDTVFTPSTGHPQPLGGFY